MNPELDALYWLGLGLAMTFAIACMFLTGWRESSRLSASMFMVAIPLLLLAGRWPSFFMPGQLNPDESMMLAQAMKFGIDPIPWRGMDTGTGGPLNSYLLMALHWLGVPYGFPLARLTAWWALSLSLVLMFLSMRRLGGARAASVAALAAAIFHTLVTDPDFLHYSSEIASLLAISTLAYGATCIFSDRTASIRGSIPVGVLAFVVTMGKLQGVPLGAAIAFSILMLCSITLKDGVYRVLGTALGGAISAAALCTLLALAGVFPDFRISFIDLPGTYVSNPFTLEQTLDFVRSRPESRSFSQAMTWLVLASGIVTIWASAMHDYRRLSIRVLGAGLILVSLYVVLSQAGRAFPHYLNYLGLASAWILFLVFPWTSRIQRNGDSHHD